MRSAPGNEQVEQGASHGAGGGQATLGAGGRCLNVAYDLMVVLTNKQEGVAAMEEYKLDADAANDPEVRGAFERFEQRERQSIDELRGLLTAHLQRIQLP